MTRLAFFNLIEFSHALHETLKYFSYFVTFRNWVVSTLECFTLSNVAMMVQECEMRRLFQPIIYSESTEILQSRERRSTVKNHRDHSSRDCSTSITSLMQQN